MSKNSYLDKVFVQRLCGSDQDGQVIIATDDNELSGAFDKMKVAARDFSNKGLSPHLALHIPNGSPDDAAIPDGLR